MGRANQIEESVIDRQYSAARIHEHDTIAGLAEQSGSMSRRRIRYIRRGGIAQNTTHQNTLPARAEHHRVQRQGLPGAGGQYRNRPCVIRQSRVHHAFDQLTAGAIGKQGGKRGPDQRIRFHPEQHGCTVIGILNTPRLRRNENDSRIHVGHDNTVTGIEFAARLIALLKRDLRLHQLLLRLGNGAQVATQQQNGILVAKAVEGIADRVLPDRIVGMIQLHRLLRASAGQIRLVGALELGNALFGQEVCDGAPFPMVEVTKAVVLRIDHNRQDRRLGRDHKCNVRRRTNNAAQKFGLNQGDGPAGPKIAAAGCNP
mmetsp:Transcript_18553/g.30592  ORF Transcript_18553/g.30592 Transcript_18553/m.30592 type:complete len:315 (+) Transcript_18553:2813-3757(+)